MVRNMGPRGKAVAKYNPESAVATQREKLLAQGDATRQQGVSAIQRFNPDDYLGADALKSIFEQANVTRFLPQLRDLQARNARSGIRGPLKGAVEGDLASAFQRHLMATTAQFGAQRGQMALGRGAHLAEIGGTDRAQGISLMGTEMELALAREQAKKEEKAGKRKFFGSLIGGAGGFLLGGPAGAAVGARIGGSL